MGDGATFLRMSGRSALPVVRQSTTTECGLACVVMIANFLGVPIDLAQLRRTNPASLRGATLQDLVAACAALNLSTRAVRCGYDELARLQTPCILHWRFDHFVVLKAVRRRHLLIHDPARGSVKVPAARAGDAFTGVALEVARRAPIKTGQKPVRLRLGALVSFRAAEYRVLAAGLLLALVCEVMLLASPFYLQVVIDQVLGKGDRALLDTLAIAFAVLLLFQVAASTMRRLTFQYLGQVTVFDVSARVLHRLLQQSLTWFRDRELGDVQHRIQSLRRVQEFIVNAAPTLILDVLFAVLTTALMFLYDTALAALALLVTAAWGIWRVLILPLSARLANDIAASDSAVQTHLLETLRAAPTVKMLGGEPAREREWQELLAASINDRLRAGNLGIVDGALREVMFQGLRVVSIYLLAQRGLDGQMSIGMVSAFVAYLGMFLTRAGAIVDRLAEYRLLDVPLNRLADIVFGGQTELNAGSRRVTEAPSLRLDSVDFRYARNAPRVLRDCSCHIASGSFVAITGTSGGGKSTLLRLIAGIEATSAGELRLSGIRLSELDGSTLRQQVATVAEHDRLLRGSVAQNIALFDADPDRRAIRRAARSACLADEIEALPMGYETRIGDLGSSLSKGQAQRLLLARALYRRPRLLLLDEPTSALDRECEKRVLDSLVRLGATRIAVTHSDQLLAAADQVFWLHEGRLLGSRPELNV